MRLASKVTLKAVCFFTFKVIGVGRFRILGGGGGGARGGANSQ